MSNINTQGETWFEVHSWAVSELNRARLENDDPGMSERDTALLRGEIGILKRLLNLPMGEPPAPVVESPEYLDL